jgi:hypothetical protein
VVYNPEERAVGKFKYKSALPDIKGKRPMLITTAAKEAAPVKLSKFKDEPDGKYDELELPTPMHPKANQNAINLPSITDLSSMKAIA